jgi:NADH dehydrogenase
MSYDHLVLLLVPKRAILNGKCKENAIPMKNDAIEMQHHFKKFRKKLRFVRDTRERRKLLTIVVAGGGPTGVEVSGVCRNEKEYFPKEYPEIGNYGNIYLVDGGDALLAPMSKASQEDTLKALTNLGGYN